MKLCEAKPHHNKRSLYQMINVHLNKFKDQHRICCSQPWPEAYSLLILS